MRLLLWIAVAIVAYMVVFTIALSAALGGGDSGRAGGAFPVGVDFGLDEEQARNAAISLNVADGLEAPSLAVLSMVVSALGESGFRVVHNAAGSGYCGVFQAHPRNIACDDTARQARHFLIGGLGFQAGGAIHLATTRSSLSPGTIATMVEASGEPGSFYDAHRLEAERIINAWRSGVPLVSETIESASVREVLGNPRIGLSPGQRRDLSSGGIDERVIAVLAWIGRRHTFIVTSLRRDHAPGTNHEAGRAFDIGAVDRWICRGGTHDPCATLVHELADVRGPERSTELIYCFDGDPEDPNVFARADHCDHIHIAFDG